MPNKTTSVPDDVLPISASLQVPFSRRVTRQLRLHAAQSKDSLARMLLSGAELAAGRRPSGQDAIATGERMERSAPW